MTSFNKRSRRRILGLALAAILVGAPSLAWAQNVDLDVNGTQTSHPDLADAINEANTSNDLTAEISSNDIELIINNNQSVGASQILTGGRIYGVSHGLNDVTINGGGNIITYTGMGDTSLLRIHDAAGIVDLSAIAFTGGNNTTHHGGGLFVGVDHNQVSANNVNFTNLNLSGALFYNNKVNRTQGSSAGGGLAVNNLDMAAGTSNGTGIFTNLDLRNNQA